MNEAAISRRIDELLELGSSKEKPDWAVQGTAIVQGTMSVMIAVYGQGSSQVSILDESIKKARDATTGGMDGRMYYAAGAARGALLNLKGEIEAGMLGSLRKEISSGVLTDFIQLARRALEDGSEDAKNVAAVLTAGLRYPPIHPLQHVPRIIPPAVEARQGPPLQPSVSRRIIELA